LGRQGLDSMMWIVHLRCPSDFFEETPEKQVWGRICVPPLLGNVRNGPDSGHRTLEVGCLLLTLAV
jgi:hypothetical protein